VCTAAATDQVHALSRKEKSRRTSSLDESAGSGRRWLKALAVWSMAQSPSKVPGGRLGSRDGWGGYVVRLSIVHVETAIPVRVARWAVEREKSGALRRCCGRSLSSGMLRVTSPPRQAGTAWLALCVGLMTYDCSMLWSGLKREDAFTMSSRQSRGAVVRGSQL
jgi:hypothetical protein